MTTLIAGAGEIGTSLGRVLVDYNPKFVDIDKDKTTAEDEETFDILHIAFAYSEQFGEEVRKYQEIHRPKFTVVHSTVPIGTCKELGVTFSMVVGIHPHLEESIRTFTKFLAGPQASEIASYFRRTGLKVYLFDKQETLELAKLAQTTMYALQVEYVKNLKRICDEKNLSFSEVYTIPTIDYRAGYEKLGRPEFTLPLLTPIMTPQGGHCTVPNCSLWETPFTELIKKLNAAT